VPSHRGVPLRIAPPRPRAARPLDAWAGPVTTPPAESARYERPPGLAPRDWATFLLHSAAEVEHALMVQYLFAAYTLRPDEPVEGPGDLPYSWPFPDLGPERWRLHRDLIEASGQLIRQLQAESPDDPYLRGIADRDASRIKQINALRDDPV
jgi:hypothetical protein